MRCLWVDVDVDVELVLRYLFFFFFWKQFVFFCRGLLLCLFMECGVYIEHVDVYSTYIYLHTYVGMYVCEINELLHLEKGDGYA